MSDITNSNNSQYSSYPSQSHYPRHHHHHHHHREGGRPSSLTKNFSWNSVDFGGVSWGGVQHQHNRGVTVACAITNVALSNVSNEVVSSDVNADWIPHAQQKELYSPSHIPIQNNHHTQISGTLNNMKNKTQAVRDNNDDHNNQSTNGMQHFRGNSLPPLSPSVLTNNKSTSLTASVPVSPSALTNVSISHTNNVSDINNQIKQQQQQQYHAQEIEPNHRRRAASASDAASISLLWADVVRRSSQTHQKNHDDNDKNNDNNSNDDDDNNNHDNDIGKHQKLQSNTTKDGKTVTTTTTMQSSHSPQSPSKSVGKDTDNSNTVCQHSHSNINIMRSVPRSLSFDQRDRSIAMPSPSSSSPSSSGSEKTPVYDPYPQQHQQQQKQISSTSERLDRTTVHSRESSPIPDKILSQTQLSNEKYEGESTHVQDNHIYIPPPPPLPILPHPSYWYHPTNPHPTNIPPHPPPLPSSLSPALLFRASSYNNPRVSNNGSSSSSSSSSSSASSSTTGTTTNTTATNTNLGANMNTNEGMKHSRNVSLSSTSHTTATALRLDQSYLDIESPLLGDVFLRFLRVYGNEYEPGTQGFSVRAGGFRFNPLAPPSHPQSSDPIIIEDPLNVMNNVGRNSFRIAQVQRTLSEAYGNLMSLISRYNPSKHVHTDMDNTQQQQEASQHQDMHTNSINNKTTNTVTEDISDHQNVPSSTSPSTLIQVQQNDGLEINDDNRQDNVEQASIIDSPPSSPLPLFSSLSSGVIKNGTVAAAVAAMESSLLQDEASNLPASTTTTTTTMLTPTTIPTSMDTTTQQFKHVENEDLLTQITGIKFSHCTKKSSNSNNE